MAQMEQVDFGPQLKVQVKAGANHCVSASLVAYFISLIICVLGLYISLTISLC